ncbi:c-type cytochrome [Sandarakinorhabdus rubra]|uniref:c-type cytochrome n=1 Tax=Sandarakinorhabdus rubra TaxID=2672568 RepID=UPI001F1D3E92|nr:c-type cytochrome [Sandarakinorhabdus rubra]
MVALLGFGLCVAIGTVWGLGSWRAGQKTATLPEPMAVARGDAGRGAHIARVYGCVSCHGADLAGGAMEGLEVPNLTALGERYTASDLARALRRGLRPDGTAIMWPMVGKYLGPMADEDAADLHAYLASLPARPQTPGASALPVRPLALALGVLKPNPLFARSGEGASARAPRPGDPAWGAYFTRMACAECHNFDLSGLPGETPALADVMQVYDWPGFVTLTTTGRAPDGRTLGLMTDASRQRLRHLTEPERRALFDYLKRLPSA